MGVLLADPTGELAELQQQFRRYPPALREALMAGLWEASSRSKTLARPPTRADTVYVAGCLFRAVLLCAHALHGQAGRWLVNEKGAAAQPVAWTRHPTASPSARTSWVCCTDR